MTQWMNTPNMGQNSILEVRGSVDDSTIRDIYINRFTQPLDPASNLKMNRYIDEFFSELEEGSSVLLFGSGHPGFARYIRKNCPNIGRIGCVDRIKEASIGLIHDDINFYHMDVLVHPLPREYDYVFSSHTLEHFTRADLLGKVVPRLMDAAIKEMVAVVPFEKAWEDEPTHRCRFYFGDELFCLSKQYKLIYYKKELMLKFSI